MRFSKFVQTLLFGAFAVLRSLGDLVFDVFKAIALVPLNLMVLPSLRSVSALLNLSAVRSFAIRLLWRAPYPLAPMRS